MRKLGRWIGGDGALCAGPPQGFMLPTLALALLEEASRQRFLQSRPLARADLVWAPATWWKAAPGLLTLASAPVLLWAALEV